MVEIVLNQAVRRKETVELIYLDRKGCLTQRRVRILGLGEKEVRVYCWERRAFRRLRREGILAAARTENRYGKGPLPGIPVQGKNVSF